MTNDLPKNSFTEILSDLQARADQSTELLTTREAAVFLNLSPACLERDRCIGPSVGGAGPLIPYVRVGRKAVRYRRSDLEAHIIKNLYAAPDVSDEPIGGQLDD